MVKFQNFKKSLEWQYSGFLLENLDEKLSASSKTTQNFIALLIFGNMPTFASFIITAIDAFRMLSTLLIMPSVSNKGKTISIACLASDVSVREISHSLNVNDVIALHNLSPELLTVSFTSSIARNAAVHILFKCFPTCITRIKKSKSVNKSTIVRPGLKILFQVLF